MSIKAKLSCSAQFWNLFQSGFWRKKNVIDKIVCQLPTVHKKILLTCKLDIGSDEVCQSYTIRFQLDIDKLVFFERFAWKIQNNHYRPKFRNVFPNLCLHKPRTKDWIGLQFARQREKLTEKAEIRPRKRNLGQQKFHAHDTNLKGKNWLTKFSWRRGQSWARHLLGKRSEATILGQKRIQLFAFFKKS